jgi:hypothetical protein
MKNFIDGMKYCLTVYNSGLKILLASFWRVTRLLWLRRDPTPEHVISDQDRTHRIVVTGLCELPFGQGRKYDSSLPSAALKLISGAGVWGFDFRRTERRPHGGPVVQPESRLWAVTAESQLPRTIQIALKLLF